jgi:hypothetical protein
LKRIRTKKKEIKEMADLNKDKVHYTKFSVNQFKGKQERYRVNQSLRTTTNTQMIGLTWAFTRDSYELWNSINSESEDYGWEGFNWAENYWKELRKEYKRDVILWVAKACHPQKYKKGEVQKNIRIPKTVSILAYFPKQQLLVQTTKIDNWTIEFEYHDVDHKMYNMIYEWRNPATSVTGGTAPGGW